MSFKLKIGHYDIASRKTTFYTYVYFPLNLNKHYISCYLYMVFAKRCYTNWLNLEYPPNFAHQTIGIKSYF